MIPDIFRYFSCGNGACPACAGGQLPDLTDSKELLGPRFSMRYFPVVIVALIGTPFLCMGGQNAVVLTPASSQDVDLGKVVSDISARGDTATAIPAEEADIRQAGLLNNGGPVVVADPGVKGGYKVYDGVTGADITKRFNSWLADKEEPPVMPKPNQPKPVKPVSKPQPKEPVAFNKNHIGLSAGMSSLRKNADSLDVLAANNSGAQIIMVGKNWTTF